MSSLSYILYAGRFSFPFISKDSRISRNRKTRADIPGLIRLPRVKTVLWLQIFGQKALSRFPGARVHRRSCATCLTWSLSPWRLTLIAGLDYAIRDLCGILFGDLYLSRVTTLCWQLCKLLGLGSLSIFSKVSLSFFRFLSLYFIWRRTALTLAHCHFVVHCCANAVDADSQTHTHSHTTHTHTLTHKCTMRQQLRFDFALDRASLLSIVSHRVEFFLSHQFHLNLSMDTQLLLVARSFFVLLLHCLYIPILTTRKYIYLWRCTAQGWPCNRICSKYTQEICIHRVWKRKGHRKGEVLWEWLRNSIVVKLLMVRYWIQKRRLKELELNPLLYHIMP